MACQCSSWPAKTASAPLVLYVSSVRQKIKPCHVNLTSSALSSCSRGYSMMRLKQYSNYAQYCLLKLFIFHYVSWCYFFHLHFSHSYPLHPPNPDFVRFWWYFFGDFDGCIKNWDYFIIDNIFVFILVLIATSSCLLWLIERLVRLCSNIWDQCCLCETLDKQRTEELHSSICAIVTAQDLSPTLQAKQTLVFRSVGNDLISLLFFSLKVKQSFFTAKAQVTLFAFAWNWNTARR